MFLKDENVAWVWFNLLSYVFLFLSEV